MRISIRIGAIGRRLLATYAGQHLVVRFIVAKGYGPISGQIISSRYPITENPVHACVEVLCKQGTIEMEAAYARLTTAHGHWLHGRHGLRARSPAGRLAMTAEAITISDLAMAYANAYRELIAIEASQMKGSPIPDWLESALEDLDGGHSPRQTADDLVHLLIKPHSSPNS